MHQQAVSMVKWSLLVLDVLSGDDDSPMTHLKHNWEEVYIYVCTRLPNPRDNECNESSLFKLVLMMTCCSVLIGLGQIR